MFPQRVQTPKGVITPFVSFCLVMDRVNKELAGRQGKNSDLAKTIRDRLSRFHSEMMDLRDALNEAVNNTARAAEINNVNEKTLEDNQVSWNNNNSKKEERMKRDINSLSVCLSEEDRRPAVEAEGGERPVEHG